METDPAQSTPQGDDGMLRSSVIMKAPSSDPMQSDKNKSKKSRSLSSNLASTSGKRANKMLSSLASGFKKMVSYGIK